MNPIFFKVFFYYYSNQNELCNNIAINQCNQSVSIPRIYSNISLSIKIILIFKNLFLIIDDFCNCES